MRNGVGASLDALAFDRTLETPIHRQIYSEIRGYILSRRLPPRAKLPATARTREALGVGRNTVVAAYEQLHGGRFVEARPGRHTRRRTARGDRSAQETRRGCAA